MEDAQIIDHFFRRDPVDAMRSLLVVMCSILSNDGQFLIHACVQKRIILCLGKG